MRKPIAHGSIRSNRSPKVVLETTTSSGERRPSQYLPDGSKLAFASASPLASVTTRRVSQATIRVHASVRSTVGVELGGMILLSEEKPCQSLKSGLFKLPYSLPCDAESLSYLFKGLLLHAGEA